MFTFKNNIMFYMCDTRQIKPICMNDLSLTKIVRVQACVHEIAHVSRQGRTIQLIFYCLLFTLDYSKPVLAGCKNCIIQFEGILLEIHQTNFHIRHFTHQYESSIQTKLSVSLPRQQRFPYCRVFSYLFLWGERAHPTSPSKPLKDNRSIVF